MRYTKPIILRTAKAACGIKSITSDKSNPRVLDNPNNLNSAGTDMGYEADE